MAVCLCGCGESVKEGKSFVHGHNSRYAHPMMGKKHSPETLKKLSDSHQGPRPWRLGWNPSIETRKKMSESHTGVPLSTKHREGLKGRIAKVLANKSDEERREWHRKIGLKHKGKFVSDETKRKCSEANKGRHYSPSTEFNSTILKERYRDPVYVKKMAAAWNIKPNKPETLMLQLLNDLYPGQWKYTGDFSFTIDGKSPDFTNCNGQKKIIEIFGDYWHRGQDPQDRIDTFKPFGYETLVIWERELKDMSSVINRIREFSEAA